MPYKSDAQRAYFHAAESRGEMKPSVVKEFDKASKGKELPEHVKEMSQGGYACMYCGGEVGEEGFSDGFGGDAKDFDGDDDGTTEQSEDTEKQRARAMYGRAMVGR